MIPSSATDRKRIAVSSWHVCVCCQANISGGRSFQRFTSNHADYLFNHSLPRAGTAGCCGLKGPCTSGSVSISHSYTFISVALTCQPLCLLSGRYTVQCLTQVNKETKNASKIQTHKRLKKTIYYDKTQHAKFGE